MSSRTPLLRSFAIKGQLLRIVHFVLTLYSVRFFECNTGRNTVAGFTLISVRCIKLQKPEFRKCVCRWNIYQGDKHSPWKRLEPVRWFPSFVQRPWQLSIPRADCKRRTSTTSTSGWNITINNLTKVENFGGHLIPAQTIVRFSWFMIHRLSVL